MPGKTTKERPNYTDIIRLVFSDMITSSISDRFAYESMIETQNIIYVLDYLVREEELIKLKDANGELKFKPLPKLLETLRESGLGHLIGSVPTAKPAKATGKPNYTDTIRLAFSDMITSSICDHFPDVPQSEIEDIMYVTRYLVNTEELTKLKDANGELKFKPLPKLLETLRESGLGHLIGSVPTAKPAKATDEEDQSLKSEFPLPKKEEVKEVKEEPFPNWPTLEYLASYEIMKQDLDHAIPSEMKDQLLYLQQELSETYYDFSYVFNQLGFKVEILSNYIDGVETDRKIVITPKAGDKHFQAHWHLKKCGFDNPWGGSTVFQKS